MAADYGETFELWREGAAGPWHDYTHHAFVERLGDGNTAFALRKNWKSGSGRWA